MLSFVFLRLKNKFDPVVKTHHRKYSTSNCQDFFHFTTTGPTPTHPSVFITRCVAIQFTRVIIGERGIRAHLMSFVLIVMVVRAAQLTELFLMIKINVLPLITRSATSVRGDPGANSSQSALYRTC